MSLYVGDVLLFSSSKITHFYVLKYHWNKTITLLWYEDKIIQTYGWTDRPKAYSKE